ncbi:MAG TPA: hypothetical protein VMH01_15565 [Puia sp.]|nr:hypothetical protein [Puia sp.]
METINLISSLAAILLIPLLPAYIIYKFLPSRTAVKGPFRGLHINLTGAFGGYFLLVIITVGLFYYQSNNQLAKDLKEANLKLDSVNSQLLKLNNDITNARSKYQVWKMLGKLDSRSPEMTKIFIDEKSISINALGKFDASMVIRTDHNRNVQLPDAVCFFNKNEGYSVVDLSQKENAAIDTLNKSIQIVSNIRLSYQHQSKGKENW